MINKVILIGNLGKNSELKYTASGMAVANFSIATTEKYKDKTNTEWHNITVFGKTAESLNQYLTKGKQVYIEGKLKTDSYDKDGTKIYKTSIIANIIQLLGGKNDSGNQLSFDAKSELEQMAGAKFEVDNSFSEDDIPF